MGTGDTDRRGAGRHRAGRRRGAVPVLLGALLLALTSTPLAVADDGPAATSEDGSLALDRGRSSEQPPGLDGRDTHLTLLTADFSECFELAITRAADVPALSAVVPSRYTLFTQVPPAGGVNGRVAVIDASCVTSVDRQQRERRSTVTLGVAQVVARDGVPTPNSWYVLWLGTDDAVLAARLRQVGMPAEFLPATSASQQPGNGTSVVRVDVVGDGLAHRLSATVVEPAPVVLPSGTPFTAYYDGPRGDVRFVDVNALTAGTPAVVTGSLTGIEVLQPLLVAPRFATLNGTRFPTGFVRGGWTRTVERLD